MIRYLTASFILLTSSSAVFAQADAKLLSPDRPIEQVIDHYIDAKLSEDKTTPALPANDAAILRRQITKDRIAARAWHIDGEAPVDRIITSIVVGIRCGFGEAADCCFGCADCECACLLPLEGSEWRIARGHHRQVKAANRVQDLTATVNAIIGCAIVVCAVVEEGEARCSAAST